MLLREALHPAGDGDAPAAGTGAGGDDLQDGTGHRDLRDDDGTDSLKTQPLWRSTASALVGDEHRTDSTLT
ncbi:hypothetical protein GCM10027261_17450 [Geodermatophilus arenarius]